MRDAAQALTVLAEIAPASRPVLEHRLAVIAADLDGNSMFRPRELPDTHFMALAIVGHRRGELISSCLRDRPSRGSPPASLVCHGDLSRE